MTEFYDLQEDYLRGVLAGNGSISQSIQIFELRDPRYVNGDLDVAAIAQHNCIIEEVAPQPELIDTFDRDIDITGVVEAEPGIWLVEFIEAVSLGEVSQLAAKKVIVVTEFGIGPVVEQSNEDDSTCPSFYNGAAEELIARLAR